MTLYGGELLHIHDGDTFLFRLTLGFGVKWEHDIRLADVNAPELATPAGKVSLAWVTAWFAAHPGPYTLRTGSRETEKYGRALAFVIAADGHDLSTDIVAAGQAVVYIMSMEGPT